MIKLSQMVICFRKGPNQSWGLARGLPVQMGLGEARLRPTRAGEAGPGTDASCCLIFPPGPTSAFPVEVRLAATPLFSCCLILFSNSTIKTEHLMDAQCYRKLLKVYQK